MPRCSTGQSASARRCCGAGCSAERPIAILSGNDIEHALLALAAMLVGIPYAPISPAYSLMSSDFGKLRTIIESAHARHDFRERRQRLRPRHRGLRAGRCRTGGDAQSAGGPPGDFVRRPRRRRGRERRCRRRGQGDARQHRQIPVHLRLDRPAERRDQHPPHAVLQPGDDRRRLLFRAGRAAGGDRLAALEPHLRQQPQFQFGADQWRLALHRRRQSDAAGRTEDRAQSARDRADDLFQRAEGLRGAAAAFPRRRDAAQELLLAG